MNRKCMTLLICALTLAGSIACFFLLPETVAVQWNYGGEVQNSLPRVGACLIPVGLTALLLLIAWSRDGKGWIWLGWLGVVIEVLLLVMNL